MALIDWKNALFRCKVQLQTRLSLCKSNTSCLIHFPVLLFTWNIQIYQILLFVSSCLYITWAMFRFYFFIRNGSIMGFLHYQSGIHWPWNISHCWLISFESWNWSDYWRLLTYTLKLYFHKKKTSIPAS